MRPRRAGLLLLSLCLAAGAAGAKRGKKAGKKAAKCTACVRVVGGSRARVAGVREELEPLREKKIETGRGADRVYNKRFTKTYDVELLHRVERVLQQSCAQPDIMVDLEVVRACRTLRDDHAEELVELLLRGGEADGGAFCADEVEACADEAAAEAVPRWKPPALRSESEPEAQASWHRAGGSGSVQGAVAQVTARSFFERVAEAEGDVLLLLYRGAEGGGGGGGRYPALLEAWDDLAQKLRPENLGDSEADPLTLGALSLDGNDLPITLPIALSEAYPEVIWFGDSSKDMPEALFGGEQPPMEAHEFAQELTRQLMMRSREKSYATAVNTVLTNLNKQKPPAAPKAAESPSPGPSPASAEAKEKKDGAAPTAGWAPPWVRAVKSLLRDLSRPGFLTEENRAEIATRLADASAAMSETSRSLPAERAEELLHEARREEEAARLTAAKLQKELKDVRRELAEAKAHAAL